jgi:hypothetical protein
VLYLHDGKWESLEELVRGGMAVAARPWNQKQEVFARVAVRYQNGTHVVTNRGAEALTVETLQGRRVLPPTGWAVYTEDGSFLAWSGHLPGTTTRVDELREGAGGLRFLNPRGTVVEGSNRLRLWRGDELLWSVDPETGTAYQGNESFALSQTEPPLTSLDLTTPGALRCLRPTAGILAVDAVADGLSLRIIDGDPQLTSPPLSLAGRKADRLLLTMSSDAGEVGQLYFATDADGAISERQVVHFEVVPDGRPHEIEIAVGDHLGWAGRTVTRLRLDPISGPEQAAVVLRSLRLVPAR